MKNVIRLSLAVLLFFSFSHCKKKMDTTPSGGQTGKSINFKRLVILTDTSLKTDLSLAMRVPGILLDVYAYGNKNTLGAMTKVNKLFLYNPVNKLWVYISFNGNYPSRMVTTAGIITEFTNYNKTNSTVDVIITDSVHNKVLKTIIAQKLSPDILNNFDSAAAYFFKKSAPVGNRVAGGTIITVSPQAKQVADIVGLMLNGAGCIVGIATIGETAGLSLFLNGISTFSNCLNAVDGLLKLVTGNDVLDGPYACDLNYVEDVLGLGVDCIPPVPSLTSVLEFAANCGADVLGGATDLASCAPDDDAPPTPARSTGDPHLTTMDGLKYNFQGYGEFVAVKSTSDNFEIQARQVDVYNTNRVTLNTAIAVKTGSDVICALVNPLRLYRNNIKLPSDFGTITLADGSTLFKNGTDIKLTTSQGDVILIRWLNTGWLLDYMITLASPRKGKVKGIFGNFDSNPQNDLALSDGTPISADSLFPKFADSWRITQASSLFFYDSSTTTESYTDRSFPRVVVNTTPQQQSWAKTVCSNAGVKDEPYYSECVYDVAVTNAPALANSSLWAQAYFDQTTAVSHVGSDVNYFKGVRLEVSSDQTDTTQLNLINWKTGVVYKLREGAAYPNNIDAVAAITCGISLFTPAALKSCGASCGVSSINSIIDNQDWNTVLKGNLDRKLSLADDDPAQNKNNPGYIPVSNWDAIYSAANIDSIYQQKPLNPLANDATVNCEIAAADNTCNLSNGVPLNNSVFRFITQDGKKGFFIVSGFDKMDGTNKYWITLDIKIEK